MTDSFSLPTNENPNFDEDHEPHVFRSMPFPPQPFATTRHPRAIARIPSRGFSPCA